MAKRPIADIELYFGQIEDPRIERRKLHKLLDIIVIAICAVICGADNWVDIQYFWGAQESLVAAISGTSQRYSIP